MIMMFLCDEEMAHECTFPNRCGDSGKVLIKECKDQHKRNLLHYNHDCVDVVKDII